MGYASILVVDDDAVFRGAICRELRASGCVVQEAGDGVKALRSLNAEPPDLMIIELTIPDGAGVELIHAVKRDCPSARVLATSWRSHLRSLDLLDMALLLGADATLAKPFAVGVLLEKVAHLMMPESGNCQGS